MNQNKQKYEAFSAKGYVYRLLWSCVWALLARPLPKNIGNRWKIFLLKLFGAEIHSSAIVYSGARIIYPAHLVMEANAIIGENADIDNLLDKIILKKGAIVSQKAYLCCGSHDISSLALPFSNAPICIGERAWVASSAFIGRGVTVGEGAVVAACSVVVKDVAAWTVVGGNPAKTIKKREILS